MRVFACVALAALVGCRHESTSAPAVIRLVDLKLPSAEGAATASARAAKPRELRFDGDAAPPWVAGPGLGGVGVRGGRLAGRTTTAGSVLAIELPQTVSRDALHELQIRMRVRGAGNLRAMLLAPPKPDLQEAAELEAIIPWAFSSPLNPDGEFHTYALRTPRALPMSQRTLLVRPADTADAAFEIESVRLVSRQEHMASVPAGLSWQGLGEIYRETLVARSPDSLRFDVTLPQRPRLQLALGTIEQRAVTFRVSVGSGAGNGDQKVFERTVTVPYRWDTAAIDLLAFGGKRVTLSLTVVADAAGAIGFWGTPVIREAAPPPATIAGKRRPRGVILLWADTLRRDHLSFYGYSRKTTPTLERMSAEGAVFDDCVAQATWTKASGPSLLSSLYPTTSTVLSFNDVLPSSATTVAEAYRAAGYSTIGLASIAFVGKGTNLHQGFEEFHEQGSFEPPGGLAKFARVEVDRLLPWLDAHQDGPFFILLHIRDPHSPFKPEAPYDTMWASPEGRAAQEHRRELVKKHIRNPLMRTFGMPSKDDLLRAGIDPEAYVAYEKDLYDGAIRAMDAEIGRVRERLEELGLDRETLIAFISDHGEEFLEHGRMFHQQSVYGELTSVPLFFWWPGMIPAGVRAAPTVQNVDIMPTLLALSGIRPPTEAQGASLLGLLDGTERSWRRPAITEAIGRVDPTTPQDDAWSIIVGDHKLVHRPKPPAGRGEYELYDRRTDRFDRKDIAAANPEIVARLATELESWRRMATAARLKPDAAIKADMSPEDLERLRALGYIQ